MKTGCGGTFVISWSQTALDGFQAAPIDILTVGAAWSWGGELIRVDGPASLLRLEDADMQEDSRKRAARAVRRLVGVALGTTPARQQAADDAAMLSDDYAIIVSDGLKTYTLTLIPVGQGAQPLVMFSGPVPPRQRDLWVVHHNLGNQAQSNPMGPASGGVICFTPGTMVQTPQGPRPVEALREGQQVNTKDSGPQDILWIGQRRMTGARLFAMPHLRPVRVRAGAFGIERPDQELVLSPEHRLLVTGPSARALFNTPEVLVRAADLVNGRTVVVDTAMREVTYIHLMLPAHHVVWANGVECESFHPASTALSTLSDADRQRLFALQPMLEHETSSYGGFARRSLSATDAAILLHKAA